MTGRHDPKVPHNIEAEQAVLGGLLLDNDAFDRVDGLEGSHFYVSAHRLVYEHIVGLVAAGIGADVVTVYERLVSSGKAEQVGGLGYLNALATQTPGAANVGRYAAIVRDRAVRRQLLALAAEVPDLIAGADEARTLVDRLQSRLELLAQQRTKSQPVRAADDLGRYFDQLQSEAEGTVQATATGFRDLDEKLGGGLRGGELVVVAGRPAMGKTAFALNIAGNVARAGSSLVLSLEMPKAQLHQRNVAAFGRIPLSRLRRPALLTHDDWNRVTAATRCIAELNLFLDDQPALTLSEVRAKARAVKRKHGLNLMIIDYLGLMTGGSSENRNQEVGSYSRGLKALAKELEVPIIALAQLNRGVENRDNKRPRVADLRDSGEIEQDADVIMFLYRDEVYDPDSYAKGVCELLIEKQRQGETGSVQLRYEGQFVRFDDLPDGFQVRQEPLHARPQKAIRSDL